MLGAVATWRMRENAYESGSNAAACRAGDRPLVAQAITLASAATTASMLRLLMAATQMRPESTP